MTTITEDYVSFEIAKLLKEKGFNEPCLMCYTSDKKLGNYGHYNSYKNSDVFSLTAPTIQMAMKWLREVHNIVVEPFIQQETKYVWYIHRIETIVNKKSLIFCWASKNTTYERYEEACEAAIKYCLEHLI